MAVNTFSGGLLSRQAGGTAPANTTLYAFDTRGDVAQRVNTSGLVQSSDAYNAYGQQLSSPSGDEFGFGGQAGYRTDPETGLCLLGQRYYDPQAGRFLTRDPLGYAGGMDLYAYADDDPVNGMDPSGLCDDDDPECVNLSPDGNGFASEHATLGDYHQAGLDCASFLTQNTPGVSDVLDAAAAATGCDVIQNTPVSVPDRVEDGVGAAMDLASLFDGGDGFLDMDLDGEGGGCGGGLCLAAGTPVWTPTGEQAVQSVQVGQQVLTRDPQTGKDEVRTVTATVARPADALVTLSLSDPQTGKSEALTCTPEHPLYVTGRGWVEAGDLAIGTRIVTRAGPPLTVTDVQWQRDQTGQHPFTVYNLTVADDHTYFAGDLDGGLWAHNEGPCEILKRSGDFWESAGRLDRMAKEAENSNIGIHGVSVTTGEPPYSPFSTAARDAVKQVFPVHDTPTIRDPLHKTVELPNPVTNKVARLFNQLFGRSSGN